MTDSWTQTQRWRRCFGLAITLVMAACMACNRAVPEKTTGQANPAESSPSTLAASSNGADKAILPPAQPDAKAPAEPAAGSSVPINAIGANNPGVQIESVSTLPANATSEETPAAAELSQRLSDRRFMKLELPKAALVPDQLLAFLVECDRAVQDLTMTQRAQQIGETEFLEQAKRLSSMKLEAGERLASDPTATLAQKKTAVAAQVESLSQLTGLGDVQAAQKLLQVASELTKSPDAQLAHQGRMVLMGFRLNQLVEGQIKDPQLVLDDVNNLLDKSEYRGLVELLALQQSLGVLNQLGYTEQAKQVQQRIIKEFRDSSNQELAMRTWMIEVGTSPELKAAYDAIKQTMEGEEKDATKVAAMATNFVNAYPSLNTLHYFLKAIIDLEYKGHVTAARKLSEVVANAKTKFPASPLVKDIDTVLDGHTRRLAALGQPLVLNELAGMDGAPFDWNAYRNKIVLVFFWASWELPSLNLIDNVKKLRERVSDPNFEIVGICTDDGRTFSDAEQLVTRQSLTWRNVRSINPQAIGLESAAAKALGVNAYSNFALLVDKKGIVRAVHPTFDNLEAMIGELLKQ